MEQTGAPIRFVGWSVDRVDGSSSFGTFDLRQTADEWCERLRSYGNDVHVVRAEVPDEKAEQRAELERLREIVRYMSEPDAEMAREFVELREMQQRAREVRDGAYKDGELHDAARYILGERESR